MTTFFGLLLILLGLSMFLGAFIFKLIFAFLLIFWGVSMLTRKKGHWKDWDKKTISKDSTLNEVAIMSPFNKVLRSEHFNGGKVVLILSGGELDLREVKPEGNKIELEIAAILAGIKIVVPKTWKVVIHGTAILGGYESHTEGGEEVVLHINGVAILGGVEIVN